MNPCDVFQERVTLHVHGDLSPAEGRQVEQHLKSCAACRAEHASLQATLEALDSRLFYPQEGEVDWDRFAAETAGLATGKVVPLRRRFLRPMPLARAAAVVLAVGLGWWVLQDMDAMKVGPARLPTPVSTGPVARVTEDATVMPADFQRRLEINMARQDTRAYLADARSVLLAVLESPVRCEKDELDISAERAKSILLLRRNQLLRDDLERPELARAADLCARLAGILTEISILDDCADLTAIRQLRDAVRRNRLLVKISVAEKELGGHRV